MNATSPSGTRRAGAPAAAFHSILCGLDGSRTSLEAARQAAILCAPDGRLGLVAVTWETGPGSEGEGSVSRWRADRVLSEARATARDLGVDTRASEVSAAEPAAYLLGACGGCDLLAVGAHGRSRVGGAALGSVASALLDRAATAVLVARRPPEGEFGDSVLLAVDRTPSSIDAADVAARIVGSTGGRASIVSAPSHDDATRRVLAAAAARLRRATGTDPMILDESGAAHRAVAAAARRIGASLVVTGSRGPAGLQVPRSVSARIARTAPCSVLVVRPPR